MAKVLAQDQKLFLISEIKKIDVPNYAELTSDKMYEQFQAVAEIMKYLSEPESLKKPMDREWLCDLMTIVRFDQLKTIVDKAT